MRQKYECTKCGLRLEGRADVHGIIRAYDRSGSDPKAPTLPALCWSCAELPDPGLGVVSG